MKSNLYKTLAAGFVLALALILSSCSSSDDDDIKGGTFTDSRDSKVYKWVTINGKTWMAENLNYDVPSTTTDVCYENETKNCNTYGRLYNWETAKTVCPAGWHLPSYAEWTALLDFAGVDSTDATKLMSKTGWDDVVGTDDFGFSALPGGLSVALGDIGGGWAGSWFGTGSDADKASILMIVGSEGGTAALVQETEELLPESSLGSVRCIKNN